jgi:hypothetical protein
VGGGSGEAAAAFFRRRTDAASIVIRCAPRLAETLVGTVAPQAFTIYFDRRIPTL